MPKKKAHVRSSRRVPSLTDNDIDHEISLVDHTITIEEPRLLTPDTGNNIDDSNSNSPLISPETEDVRSGNNAEASAGPSSEHVTSQTSDTEARASVAGKESVAKENGLKKHSGSKPSRSRSSKDTESAIEILYENQRGGFLCGIPLFSSAALGNLDPSAWTNFAHKSSPTDITTAQVPDPSWEWAWPEWRINHDETIETDGDGWEYSFMFSKKFSWHGPKWYNSFVRRRTWIRRRIKKGLGYQTNDPHMLSPEYFSITTTSTRREGEQTDLSRRTTGGSRDPSRDARRGDLSKEEAENITTITDLMRVLRKSRIDRERLEAVGTYIEHCSDDMKELQDYMHEIMALFVFQASRKLLLARLIQLHDSQMDKDHKGKLKSSAQQQKAENLAEAIKHADEEVRRLEYWSDIKGMAESGQSRGAVDCESGWGGGWEGLDKSGPKGVKNDDELP
ncbi:hypothetical protein M426DRAFT_18529 [Hypoxylon sp. CI-4A]|nr:hypothetical protein M426DRAFT_18529 [Hypoxylon sp. CI-4A]